MSSAFYADDLVLFVTLFGGLSGKAQVSDKKANDSKVPQFKQGRRPSIKHGLEHTAGARTNRRKIINGYECIKFERKESWYRSACTDSGSAAVKADSVAPRKK